MGVTEILTAGPGGAARLVDQRGGSTARKCAPKRLSSILFSLPAGGIIPCSANARTIVRTE